MDKLFQRRLFLAAEGALYTAFMLLDLFGRSGGLTLPLKYASVALCLLWVLTRPPAGDVVLLRAALALTLLADLFLLVLGRWYALGVLCFCGVQLLYCLRVRRHAPGTGRRSLALRLGLTAAAWVAAAALGALTPLTALALFYFCQLLLNTAESLTLPSLRSFGLGLLLFMGCDLCVGLHNLAPVLSVSPAAPLAAFAQVGMWLFYLPSQVLIALSSERK